MINTTIGAFVVVEKITTFELKRNVFGYDEVSIMDVYSVMSNGNPFYALAIRSGDEEWTSSELRQVARLYGGRPEVKAYLDMWRAHFLAGNLDEFEMDRVDNHDYMTTAITHVEGNADDRYRLVLKDEDNEINGAIVTAGKMYAASACGFPDQPHGYVVFHSYYLANMIATGLTLYPPGSLYASYVNYVLASSDRPLTLVMQKDDDAGWTDIEVVIVYESKIIKFNKEKFIDFIK